MNFFSTLWPFKALFEQLAQILTAVLSLQNALTATRQQLKAESELTRKVMNEAFEELKQNVADAFRENNETIEAATKKIEDAIASGISKEELENLNATLRTQVASNQAFQDKLNPPAPAPAEPIEE